MDGDPKWINVTLSAPSFYAYDFKNSSGKESEMDTVVVKVQSDFGTCMTFSIQNNTVNYLLYWYFSKQVVDISSELINVFSFTVSSI